MIEAPTQQFHVPCRDDDPGSVEFFGGSNQRLYIEIRFTDGMSEISESGCVARETAITLDDNRVAYSRYLLSIRLPDCVRALFRRAHWLR